MPRQLTEPNPWGATVLAAGLLLASCKPTGAPSETPVANEANVTPEASDALELFQPRPIGDPVNELPWITHLAIVDLDQDGLLDVIACEGRQNQVLWIRQVSPGAYQEQAIGQPIAGPVHVEAVDMDGDGNLDIVVASMGIVTPNNQQIGSVVILENQGGEVFANRVVLQDTWRVTDARAGDLNGNGLLDLAVGQFGYFEGAVQWLENQGDGSFEAHPLLALAGTVHAPLGDLDGDGHLDIVALVSQDSEEARAFLNDGRGHFSTSVLHRSRNKDFGSSGLTVGDLNQNGALDIVYTNGDGFDYSTPGSRPWHGLQWLENKGGSQFEYHRIANIPGAYSPVIVDLDGDGHRDIVVASWFNDWSDPAAASLIWVQNLGGERFFTRALARSPTHLVTVAAADMDGDGQVELITGAMHFYPPYDKTSRVTLWKRRQ